MTPGNRFAIILAITVLLAWGLGGHDLWAPDEPYFAEGAREMIADGQWAVPHVNGVITTDKPPLFFWLIAVFSLPGGEVTPFTARLPSLIAALLCIAITIRLGARFSVERTAFLAAVVLATAQLFWDKARTAQIDSLLCCLIWVSLAAFALWRAGDVNGRRAGLVFWSAAALATLAKGPVGFLLPLGIALITLVLDRGLARWRSFAPIAGPLVFLLILGVWMAFATIGSGGDYSVWGALKEHFVDRGLHGMHHKQPFWYYGKMLPTLLLPWSAIAVGAVVRAWRRRDDPFDRLLLVAASFVVVFFSISTEKRGLYILPAFPAFALMISRLVAAHAGWGHSSAPDAAPVTDPRWITVAQRVLGALLTTVAVVLPFIADREEEITTTTAIILALLLFIGGLATLLLARRSTIVASVIAPAATFAVVYLLVITFVYPQFEERKSARPFAVRISEVTASSRADGHAVLAYRLGNLPEPFAFYSNGMYTVETQSRRDLERHLLQDANVFAVVNGDELAELSEAARDRMWVVDQTRLSRRNVLLVANHPMAGSRKIETSPSP